MQMARSVLVQAVVVRIILGAALGAVVVGMAPAGWAGQASSEVQLVMLAEPQPPSGIATSKGAVTLAYRVIEVFSGEPGSASVIVRHAQLDPMDRDRLASGERVLVMAKPDAASPGRWVGSAPLRATDEAVAAFRKWGAPTDVREATPLADAVAVAKRSDGAVSRPTPAPKPVPTAVEDEVVATPPQWHEVPAAPEVEEVTPAESVAEEDAAPMSFADDAAPNKRLSPARGPGLPPSPPHRILGPAFAERDDLKLPET